MFRGQTRRGPLGGHATAFAQSQRCHVRYVQRALSYTAAVGVAGGATPCDVSERVRSFIAKAGRVRSAADAQGIEHDDECARHEIATFGGAIGTSYPFDA